MRRKTPWGLIGLALAFTLVSSTATVAVPQRPAHASGCFASGCNGKWAGNEFCDVDGIEIITRPVKEDAPEDDPDTSPGDEFVGTGRLFYSPSCQSVWGEYRMDTWKTQVADRWFKMEFELWTQAQYGSQAFKVTGADPVSGDERFQFTNWQLQTNPGSPLVFRTPMRNWSESVMLCDLIVETDPDGNPTYQYENWDAYKLYYLSIDIYDLESSCTRFQ